MGKLSEASPNVVYGFNDAVKEALVGSSSLEEAAKTVTRMMYEEFKESVVLARVFATVPFGNLPEKNKEFVNNLAKAKNITSLLNDQSLILSLIGTTGVESAWGDRFSSEGHVGIPLVSVDFINLIPMMSRLMKSLGVPLDWISNTDTKIATKGIGTMSGLFYVDAKTEVDELDRKIIPAQDFVSKYNVNTVFGFGGGYMIEKTFMVVIVFTREHIEKEIASLFMPLASIIKTATVQLVSGGEIFS
jgi:hypothetical protein